MQSLGSQFLISVLLPGSILFSAAWIFIAEVAPESHIHSWLTKVAASDISLATLVLLGSALLGGILSSLMERLELHIFDGMAAKALEINSALYNEEWECYVESLFDRQNSYLSRKAIYFFFEIRVGAASAIVWLLAMYASPCAWTSFIPLLVSVVMFGLALQTHELLANWRHHLFGADAEKRLARYSGQADKRTKRRLR
jgi:hypothetical protein